MNKKKNLFFWFLFIQICNAYSFLHADWASILLLVVLGHVFSIRSHLHLPPRAHNAYKRKVFGDVQALLILHGHDGRGHAHGNGPPHRLRHHIILDGRPKSQSRTLPCHPLCASLQRPSISGPRTCPRSSRHEPQDSCHPRLRHHAHFPSCWWILRATCSPLHCLDQVPLPQSLHL